MQLTHIILIAVFFFIAFSIGVNFGLHGALDGFTLPVIRRDMEALLQMEFSGKTHTSLSTVSPQNVDSTKTAATSVPEVSSPGTQAAATAKPSVAIEPETEAVGKYAVKLKSKMKEQLATSGPISSYLSSGKKLPIVILTCNRPELLEQTIRSLKRTNGFEGAEVLASQDGSLSSVSEIVRKSGFKLVQSDPNLKLRGASPDDGGIARHYKFSLSAAFDQFPDAPAVIVIEDDLLFSPDFYEYMSEVGRVLDTDKSVLAVSAWNDNGFKSKVSDPLALRRTEYLPGLGWLLSRELYKKELESTWPKEHWDHWMRSHGVHKGREVVYPQMPRTYHNGIKGTFMNLNTHNRYFRDISNNRDSAVTWKPPAAIDGRTSVPILWQAVNDVYEARVLELIEKCVHVRSVQDVISMKGILCIWIDVNPDPPPGTPAAFESIAAFFGLWHEHRRGAHHGMHEFPWREKAGTAEKPLSPQKRLLEQYQESHEAYVVLLNIFEDIHKGIHIKNYADLKPSDAVLMDPSRFDKRLLVELKRQKSGVVGTAAKEAGMSCNEVCSAVGKSCDPELLELLNTCPALTEHFPCRKCELSMGAEQPAYVDPQADQQFNPGTCLVNAQPHLSTCQASHAATVRLCACA